MKAATIFASMVTALPIYMNAQNTVLLNINLYPVQSIEVNSASSTVNLDYTTVEDYKNGVSVTKKDHLKIFSTGAFAIKVRSKSPTLSNSESESGIISGDITMTASQESPNSTDGFTAVPVQLSTSDTELLSSLKGSNRTFNVKYAASGGDKYINKRLASQTPTTYSTQVVLSIEPR